MVPEPWFFLYCQKMSASNKVNFSVSDEGYSRNASGALYLTSIFYYDVVSERERRPLNV